MTTTRWTDGLSDRMRHEGDREADACVEALEELGGMRVVDPVLAAMHRNDSPVPAEAPEPLRRFLAQAPALPTWFDAVKVARGEAVYLDNGPSVAVALLCKAIPEGYGAPCLSKVLHMTGLLEKHTYRRLLGVLQMVVDVASPGAFAPSGKGRIIASKLRLLHAGIRRLVRRKLPDYEAQHGVPCNHEDMLGTLMGFSLLVIDGLHLLGIDLTPADAEALFHPWLVYSVCIGIPEAYLPTSLDDARAFYAAYGRRQYVPAAQNPEGVLLAKANLEMLRGLLPAPIKRTGLRFLPEIFLYDMLGHEGCERVGITPITGHRQVKQISERVIRDTADARAASRLRRSLRPAFTAMSRRLFQSLILYEYHGVPKVVVPQQVRDLWSI